MELLYRQFLMSRYLKQNTKDDLYHLGRLLKRQWGKPLDEKIRTLAEVQILGKKLTDQERKIDDVLLGNPLFISSFIRAEKEKREYEIAEKMRFLKLREKDQVLLLEYLLAIKNDDDDLAMKKLKVIYEKDIDATAIPDEYYEMNTEELTKAIQSWIVSFF